MEYAITTGPVENTSQLAISAKTGVRLREIFQRDSQGPFLGPGIVARHPHSTAGTTAVCTSPAGTMLKMTQRTAS